VAVPRAYSRLAAAARGNNAATAMKSVVVDASAYDWEGDAPLRTPSSRTIVYEVLDRNTESSLLSDRILQRLDPLLDPGGLTGGSAGREGGWRWRLWLWLWGCWCPRRGRRRGTGNRAYRCCGFGLDGRGFCSPGFGDSAVEGVLRTPKESVQGCGVDSPEPPRMTLTFAICPPVVRRLQHSDRVDPSVVGRPPGFAGEAAAV
jgi:hypothetical protein